MKSIKLQLMKILLGGIACLPIVASADQVVIENDQGEYYVLQVGPDDTFLDIVRSMHAFEENIPIQTNTDSNEFQTYTVRFAAKTVFSNAQISRKARAIPRSYAEGITAADLTDIAYILKTMANSSLPKIKSAETALKKAGDRIDHVHPFHFLACIFTNEELKVCMRNLQGRAWVWKEFVTGITDSLAEEDGRGNLLPFVHEFAAKVKIDANAVTPILEGARWERFVNALIEIVPREGGANRYNM